CQRESGSEQRVFHFRRPLTESQTRGAQRVIVKEAPGLRRRRFLIVQKEAVGRDVQNARPPGALERRFGGLVSKEHRRFTKRSSDRQGFMPCARQRLEINLVRIILSTARAA